jgi:hypothetical protein
MNNEHQYQRLETLENRQGVAATVLINESIKGKFNLYEPVTGGWRTVKKHEI